MFRTLIVLVLALIASSPSSSQAGEIDDVIIPLQAYLDGHATRQEHHFRRAFAPDGLLVGIKDGHYSQRSAADYIAASSGGQPAADEAKRRRWIHSVNVTGKVATAVVELDYPNMRARDHMSLL